MIMAYHGPNRSGERLVGNHSSELIAMMLQASFSPEQITASKELRAEAPEVEAQLYDGLVAKGERRAADTAASLAELRVVKSDDSQAPRL
jgi:hypothetical protein